MSYFLWGMLILLVSTLIFYGVFFALVFYWHEKKVTLILVPLLYTFEFFAIGFLIISLICIVLQYLPEILLLLSSGGSPT